MVGRTRHANISCRSQKGDLARDSGIRGPSALHMLDISASPSHCRGARQRGGRWYAVPATHFFCRFPATHFFRPTHRRQSPTLSSTPVARPTAIPPATRGTKARFAVARNSASTASTMFGQQRTGAVEAVAEGDAEPGLGLANVRDAGGQWSKRLRRVRAAPQSQRQQPSSRRRATPARAGSRTMWHIVAITSSAGSGCEAERRAWEIAYGV